jgi:hypothetical protein
MSATPGTNNAHRGAVSMGGCVASFVNELKRENARLRRVTPQRLADALVAAGVIDLRAIEDREGYDNFRTWDAVIRAAIILSNDQGYRSQPGTDATTQKDAK